MNVKLSKKEKEETLEKWYVAVTVKYEADPSGFEPNGIWLAR